MFMTVFLFSASISVSQKENTGEKGYGILSLKTELLARVALGHFEKEYNVVLCQRVSWS